MSDEAKRLADNLYELGLSWVAESLAWGYITKGDDFHVVLLRELKRLEGANSDAQRLPSELDTADHSGHRDLARGLGAVEAAPAGPRPLHPGHHAQRRVHHLLTKALLEGIPHRRRPPGSCNELMPHTNSLLSKDLYQDLGDFYNYYRMWMISP
jgi:hypothetical protein